MSRAEQKKEITPRGDVTEAELAEALRAAGHDAVLGVETRAGRWFLVFGRQVGAGAERRYEDATEQEMAAAVAAAPGVQPDRLPPLKRELVELQREKLAVAAAATVAPLGAFTAELAALSTREAVLVARMTAAAPLSGLGQSRL